jgi:hypothetical protein
MRFAGFLGVLFLLGGSQVATAGPISAVTLSGGTTGPTGVDIAAAGFSFITNQSVTIDALAVRFPDNGNGTNVRLYNAGGTIASATVFSFDPTDGIFNFHSITPVTLAASTTYYVAADLILGQLSTFDVPVNGVTTNPAITYTGPVESFVLGDDPTSDAQGGAHAEAYFGPSFEIQPTATPEPSTLTLLGIGMAATAGYWWRRKRNQPAA